MCQRYVLHSDIIDSNLSKNKQQMKYWRHLSKLIACIMCWAREVNTFWIDENRTRHNFHSLIILGTLEQILSYSLNPYMERIYSFDWTIICYWIISSSLEQQKLLFYHSSISCMGKLLALVFHPVEILCCKRFIFQYIQKIVIHLIDWPSMNEPTQMVSQPTATNLKRRKRNRSRLNEYTCIAQAGC